MSMRFVFLFCLFPFLIRAQEKNSRLIFSKFPELLQFETLAKQKINRALALLKKSEATKDAKDYAKAYLLMSEAHRPFRNSALFIADSLLLEYSKLSRDDSLIFDALTYNIIDLLSINDVRSTDSLFLIAEQIIAKGSSVWQSAVYFRLKGLYYLKKFDPLKSVEYSRKSVNNAYLTNDEELHAKALSFLGYGWSFRMQMDTAAFYLNKAIYILEKKNKPAELASAYSNLGFVYRNSGNHERGGEYMQLAITNYIKSGFPIPAAFEYVRLGETAIGRKKTDEAKNYLLTSVMLFDYTGYQQGLSVAYSLMGRCYSIENKADSADYFDELSRKFKFNKNTPVNLYVQSQSAIKNFELGRYKEADSSMLGSLTIASRIIPEELIKKATGRLSQDKFPPGIKKDIIEAYRSGNFNTTKVDSAYSINPFTGQTQSKDSEIYKLIQENQTLVTLEEQRKSKNIRDSLTIVQKDVLLAKKELIVKNRTLLFTGMLLLFLAFIIYSIFKSRKRIRMEMDFTLHYAKKNLRVIEANMKSINLKARPDDHFRLLSKAIAPLTVLYSQIKMNLNEDVYLQQYLMLICRELNNSYSVGKNIMVNIDAPVYIKASKAQTIGYLINEIVSNSLLHAFEEKNEGEISISCYRFNKQYKLQVSDNGIGYEDFNVQKGKGTELIAGFAQEISAIMSRENKQGTRFEFIFS